MKIRHAIVPVAGLGTRLLPITAGVAKEMLPLGRKPTLQYVAEEVANAGIENLVLVTSEAKSTLAAFFETDSDLEDRLASSGKQDLLNSLWSHSPHRDLKFKIAIQHQQNGLGHAVLCGADDWVNDDTHVAVALGDCVLGLGGGSNVLQRMVKVAQENQADIVIAFETVPGEKVSRFGIAKPGTDPDENGLFELADVVEKPSLADAPSNLAITARYILSTRIFDVLQNQKPGVGGETQLTDVIKTMIADGATAYGLKLKSDEKRYDVGNLISYTEAFVQFALADPELSQAVHNAINQN